jgi:hypothetical protein
LARRCHALASREFADFERIPHAVSTHAAQESQVCCVCLFHHHPDGAWRSTLADGSVKPTAWPFEVSLCLPSK